MANNERQKPEFVANALRGAATLHELLRFKLTSSADENRKLAEDLGARLITDSDNIGAFLTYGIETLAGDI